MSEELEADVFGSIAKIDQIKDSLSGARRDLISSVINLSRIENRRERFRVLRKLYWEHDVNANALALAAMFDDISFSSDDWAELEKKGRRLVAAFVKSVSPGYSMPCATAECENRCYINTRTQYQRVMKAINKGEQVPPFCEDFHCTDCMDIKRSIRDRHWKDREAEHEAMKARRLVEDAERRTEIATLEAKLNLEDGERQRLYELLSKEFARQQDMRWDQSHREMYGE